MTAESLLSNFITEMKSHVKTDDSRNDVFIALPPGVFEGFTKKLEEELIDDSAVSIDTDAGAIKGDRSVQAYSLRGWTFHFFRNDER